MGDKESIVTLLGERSVLSIEKNDNGTFNLCESCDHYFYVDLTTEELIKLGNELIEIAKQ